MIFFIFVHFRMSIFSTSSLNICKMKLFFKVHRRNYCDMALLLKIYKPSKQINKRTVGVFHYLLHFTQIHINCSWQIYHIGRILIKSFMFLV